MSRIQRVKKRQPCPLHAIVEADCIPSTVRAREASMIIVEERRLRWSCLCEREVQKGVEGEAEEIPYAAVYVPADKTPK